MATATLSDLQADIDLIKIALGELGVVEFMTPTSDTPVTDASNQTNIPNS